MSDGVAGASVARKAARAGKALKRPKRGRSSAEVAGASSGDADIASDGPKQAAKARKRHKSDNSVADVLPKQTANGDVGAAPVDSPVPDEELLLLEDEPSAREANLLRLQVEELLQEARFEYEDPGIHKAFKLLKKTLRAFEGATVEPSEAQDFLDSLGLSSAHQLNFQPPEEVEISGAFSSETLALPEASVDVRVEIPTGCLRHKDHLNHQYFAARALFLKHIAALLQKSPSFRQQRWEYIHGNPRKPALVVTPKLKGCGEARFSFRILPSIPDGYFALEKLKCSRNCLRSVRLGDAGGEGEPQLLPTPDYNTSIIQDILPDTVSGAIERAAALLPHFLDAVILLKVWSRQNGLEAHPDDLGGELLAAFAAHTATAQALSPAMNTVQILKAVLQHLADPRTFKGGVFMLRQPGLTQEVPPPPLNFKGSAAVVLVDPSGWLNLAAHVSSAALQQAQAAASLAVRNLKGVVSAESAFQAVFLPRHPPTGPYDYFWRVSPPEGSLPLCSGDRHVWRVQEEEVAKLCRKALSDRVFSIRAFGRPLAATAELGKPALKDPCITLAVRVNPMTVMRAVDIGPAADEPAAAEFRAYWGHKSELRRFQDGRISEAVAWGVGPSQRHLILDMIVQHIVQRHLPGTLVTGFAGAVDWALGHRRALPDDIIASARLLEASVVRLSKQLRSLTSLALKILSVQPISAAARHTAAAPPLAHPLAGGGGGQSQPRVSRCADAIEVLVQLEGSGRWSDDDSAFRKMKAALGVQLAEELFSGFGLRALASEEFVDVFTDGFVFRLFLFSERDEAVARRLPDFAEQYQSRQRQAVHHGLMTQISAANPSFRGAARLASRWISAHLLSNHVSQEAGELLAAAAYCSGTGLPPPGAPLSGFLRFLRMLAEHPWRERPLIVDPDNSMDVMRQQSIVSSFTKAKVDGFAPSLPIATSADPASAHWTAVRPERQVVSRMVALAKRSLLLLQERMLAGGMATEMAASGAFDPGLADFDAVIVLRRDSVPNADAAIQFPVEVAGKAKQQTENLLSSAGFHGEADGEKPVEKSARAVLRTIPESVVAEWGSERIANELLVGFQPVPHYVKLLEARFGHLGLFCSDFDGGQIIAVKWRPSAFQPRPLNPEEAHTAQPLKLEASLASELLKKKKARLSKNGKQANTLLTVPHIPRVLAEIKEMGAGLVADVRLRYTAEP